jgi:NAD-dependent deacetylase
VLFGEYLPARVFERAAQLAEQADLMLCIGSSLEVYPVAELPLHTLAGGGRLAIITRSPTPLDGRAASRLDGDVVDELEALARELELTSARPAPS